VTTIGNEARLTWELFYNDPALQPSKYIFKQEAKGEQANHIFTGPADHCMKPVRSYVCMGFFLYMGNK